MCFCAESSLCSSDGSGLQIQTSNQSEKTILTLSPHDKNLKLVFILPGVTSPTVFGVSGPPGGTVGSPGPKRTSSGTGNTLKVSVLFSFTSTRRNNRAAFSFPFASCSVGWRVPSEDWVKEKPTDRKSPQSEPGGGTTGPMWPRPSLGTRRRCVNKHWTSQDGGQLATFCKLKPKCLCA